MATGLASADVIISGAITVLPSLGLNCGHSERSEESTRICACGRATGFLASLLMNLPVCHSERSEESSSAYACGRPTGFFAALRMTFWWRVHRAEPPNEASLVPSLRMTDRATQ